MEKTKINMLLNMFDNKRNFVWITDKNWNIAGGKYTFPLEGKLPEVLDIPADCWTYTEKEVYLNNHFFKCKIHCSKPNQCRAIVLQEIHFDSDVQRDIDIKTALQSLQQIKQQNTELSDSLERVSLLIYRKPYLNRMLQAVRNLEITKYSFFIQDAIQKIDTELSEWLKYYAEIELDLFEQKISFYENAEFFSAAVLSGIVLCHHERGYFHHIKITLTVSEQTAEISISLKPDMQKFISMREQLEAFSFGAHEEEKDLLNTFCLIHNGNWSVTPSEENPSCFRLQFHIPEQHSELRVYSPSKIISSKFDDIYKLMTAPIYLSHF